MPISLIPINKKTLWAQNNKAWAKSCGEKGSAVVEAMLAVPIFIGAVCTLLAFGQMVFAQAQIWHCLSQTAEQMIQIREVKTEGNLIDTAYANVIFHRMMADQPLCDSCVAGGTRAIVLTQDTKENGLDLTATYYLRVPVPYFQFLGALTRKTIHRRLFTGYLPHSGQADPSDPTVYIARYGQVFHRTMTCSKICIKIADPGLMGNLLASKKYRACEKCMAKGVTYTQFYITVQGDACHANLSCSGLKRSIRAVKQSEAGGLRPCKNCGGS